MGSPYLYHQRDLSVKPNLLEVKCDNWYRDYTNLGLRLGLSLLYHSFEGLQGL